MPRFISDNEIIMSTQDNPTDETLAGAAHVDAADGGAAVAPDALTLSEMNAILGKDFKDKDSAAKAIKDTFSYVGKRKEDIAAELRSQTDAAAAKNPDLAAKSDVLRLETDLFYAQNPQYKGYESLIAKMGGRPAEVVDMPEFKTVFEKGKIADEAEQKKSVVSSNARLAETKTYMDEAIKMANARGASGDDVALVFARAFNEASGK